MSIRTLRESYRARSHPKVTTVEPHPQVVSPRSFSESGFVVSRGRRRRPSGGGR
jgi:hypothetical protein